MGLGKCLDYLSDEGIIKFYHEEEVPKKDTLLRGAWKNFRTLSEVRYENFEEPS